MFSAAKTGKGPLNSEVLSPFLQQDVIVPAEGRQRRGVPRWRRRELPGNKHSAAPVPGNTEPGNSRSRTDGPTRAGDSNSRSVPRGTFQLARFEWFAWMSPLRSLSLFGQQPREKAGQIDQAMTAPPRRGLLFVAQQTIVFYFSSRTCAIFDSCRSTRPARVPVKRPSSMAGRPLTKR